MGGLLHDIGKKELPKAIVDKTRSDMTSQERELYETHPIRSRDLLTPIKTVPEDVVQIVMHHHENMVGRGFPFRLMRSRIHPLAKLVAVANEFCQLVLKHPQGRDVSAKEALTELYQHKSQEMDPNFLKALMRLFDYPVPKDLGKNFVSDEPT